MALHNVRARKTNATTLTFDRNTSATASAATLTYYLVTFENDTTVQTGGVTGWTATTSAPTIAAVATARSFATCTFGYLSTSCGRTSSTGTTPGIVAATLDLGAGPTTTTLTLTRLGKTSSDVVWNVVQLDQ
jgi:hypothetical protein